jgi:hypothetical protein
VGRQSKGNSVRGGVIEYGQSELELRRVGTKRARMEAVAFRAIRDSTEWLTAKEIAGLASLGRADPFEVIGQWKQEGRVFALRQGGEDHFPRYALDQNFHPLPVIEQILIVLAGYEPELVAAWFASRSRFLSGLRPLELVEVEPERVVAAARNLIEQQHQG